MYSIHSFVKNGNLIGDNKKFKALINKDKKFLNDIEIGIYLLEQTRTEPKH